MKRSTRRFLERHGVILRFCALTVAIYTYFLGGYINNPMSNSAADLTVALVKDHSLQIDRYAGNTSDVATRNGHTYSGFGPGLSFVLIPAYLLIAPVVAVIPTHLMERSDQMLFEGAYATSPQLKPSEGRTAVCFLVIAGTLLYATPLIVVSTILFARVCIRHVPTLWRQELVALLFFLSFGTLAFCFATNLTHTSIAAAIIWIGVCAAILWQREGLRLRQFAGVGALLGFAPTIDYQAVLFSLLAIVFLLSFVEKRRRLLKVAFAVGVGAAVPVLLSLTYHWFAFGNAFTNAYRFRERVTDRGIFSVGQLAASLPNLEKIRIAFVGPFCGIIFYNPLVLVGFAASLFLAAREVDSLRRRIWLLSAATILANIGIYSSYPLSVGPGSLPTFAIRYTIYSTPFAALALAGVVVHFRGARKYLLIVFGAINAIPVWIFSLYGIPVLPSRDYAGLFREIGPGNYSLTKLHQGHLIASSLWGWAGILLIGCLLAAWWPSCRALVTRERRLRQVTLARNRA